MSRRAGRASGVGAMLRLLFFRPGGGERAGRSCKNALLRPCGPFSAECGHRSLADECDILLGTWPAALGGAAVTFLRWNGAERVWAGAIVGAPSVCFSPAREGLFPASFLRGCSRPVLCLRACREPLPKRRAGGTRVFACSGQPTERKNASSDAFGRGVLRLPGRWAEKSLSR